MLDSDYERIPQERKTVPTVEPQLTNLRLTDSWIIQPFDYAMTLPPPFIKDYILVKTGCLPSESCSNLTDYFILFTPTDCTLYLRICFLSACFYDFSQFNVKVAA